MKIWFDTEFIEDGKTIDLISIGIVREDGAQYYAENCECNLAKAGDWVKANVLPSLGKMADSVTREQIGREIKLFVGDKPEFWAYYADYDWVVLCQLFGTMMMLPDGWPMYCRDVKQLCDSFGNPALPPQATADEHHALKDALWTKGAWEWLMALTPSGG